MNEIVYEVEKEVELNRAKYGMVIFGFLVLIGCKSEEKPSTPKPAERVEDAPVIAPVTDADPVEAPQEIAKPGTILGTTIVRLKSEAVSLSKFPYKGEPQDNFIAWEDKLGTNAVVFTIEKHGKTGSLLTAIHGRIQEDGTWKVIRDFKELIKVCEMDTILEAYSGDWSVTDMDKNDVGEATFAWKTACVSDHSPFTFKVLMTEDGAKYILRGTTRVEGLGGEFKADPEFAKAPQGFQTHAEKVWNTLILP